ncbi:MAG TPA: DUF5947 family protein [Polyangiaceae bacterium]|nr:DUF5947 family protein [Polyangiaceae bacterium]
MKSPARERAIAALRRFTARPRAITSACELCSVPLPARHSHLWDPRDRSLACACTSCAVLFPTGGGGPRLRVETRVTPVETTLSPADLHALGIPVSIAFLVPSALFDCVFCLYPNARGATEGVLPRSIWETLATGTPGLTGLEAEVEGVFLDAEDGVVDAHRISIDVAHGVIGLLREGVELRTSVRGRIRRHLAELREGSHART